MRLYWDLTEWQIQKRVDGGFWKRQDDAEEMTSEGFKKKDGPGARWHVAFPPSTRTLPSLDSPPRVFV